MHAAQAVHVLQLARYEPAEAQAGEKEGPHLQLQRRQLLHQVRRDDWHLSRWRRVSFLLSFLFFSFTAHREVELRDTRRVLLR